MKRTEAGMTTDMDLAERRAEFLALAEKRYAEFLATGECIPWEEARRYFKDRVAGKAVERPQARKMPDSQG